MGVKFVPLSNHGSLSFFNGIETAEVIARPLMAHFRTPAPRCTVNATHPTAVIQSWATVVLIVLFSRDDPQMLGINARAIMAEVV